MLKQILKTAVAVSLAVSVAFGAQGARFNVIDGDAEEAYSSFLSSKLDAIGFSVSDAHEKINEAYEKTYGSPQDLPYDKEWMTSLDNLGFFPVSNDVKLRNLLIKAPELGAFSPFDLLIYKKKLENKTYIGHVSPSTMLDILGIKDKVIRREFTAIFGPLDELIQKELGGKVAISGYNSLPEKTMMNFELTFDKADDLSAFTDTFQEKFEAAFEEKHYIIAGFKNFKEVYADLNLKFDAYDAYWTYSLCHFTFSYNIFNKGRPDVGVFAPCSMYMYIKKGTNKLMIGMPLLTSWVATMDMKDPVKIKSIKDLDKDVIKIMKRLGTIEI